jgi:lipopolysaccharide export system protein LptC
MAPPRATLRSRLAVLLPLLILAGLAFGSYYLLQIGLPSSQEEAAKPLTHTADAFATDLTVSMLDVTGITHYRLNAATMVHYEDDASANVTLPALRGFTPGQPDVTAFARRGTMNGDQSIIDLNDQARILRAPGPTDPAMEADSEHFRVLTNDDIIESEKPVKLQRGLSVMFGDSMTYHNATRQMFLYGRVHGQIAAHEPTAPVPSK